jgi:hypothetical protein
MGKEINGKNVKLSNKFCTKDEKNYNLILFSQ